jgi:hypothetical protein
MSISEEPKVINYWTWKDSELIEELKSYKIEMEEYDRKKAIALIKRAEIERGDGTEMAIESEEGDSLDMNDLKPKDTPKLILSRVIFHNTSDQDLPYVPVGHNGKAFYIPREVEVDIPDYILDSCIKDAVEERMVPEVSPTGDINWKTRKVQRFPYTIVKKSFPAPEGKKKQ